MKSVKDLVLCLAACAALASTALAAPEDAVVKIFSSVRFPNPIQPWAKSQPQQVFGSGFVIDGKRILTNAHVVGYGSEIFVRDGQGGEKIEAKVVAINYDIDLAILSVNDEKFFDKRTPLPRLAQLPRIGDGVSVYGFPVGGNDMSVTKGEVSRIEFGSYGRSIGLIIQVSAAVNPGNSGGPAVGWAHRAN